MAPIHRFCINYWGQNEQHPKDVEHSFGPGNGEDQAACLNRAPDDDVLLSLTCFA